MGKIPIKPMVKLCTNGIKKIGGSPNLRWEIVLLH